MSEIRPFAALRFARDPEPRLAPPWDVIDEAERARLGGEPENIVHLTLPPGPQGDRDYARAGETLALWLERGVLVRDPEPRLYLMRERTSDGRERRGMLALLRLANYEERVVLPHERTLPGARLDRLLLTREVRANLEPLFFLYEDREGELDAELDAAPGEPLANCTGPDGTRLELRGVSSPALISRVQRFLESRPVVIADGHHRYDTMLRYRDEQRETAGANSESPCDFVLAYLVNAFDPGSEIRAIHRLLANAPRDVEALLRAAGFQLQERPADESAESLLAALAQQREKSHAFALVSGSALWIAERLRGESLDVEVLHDELIPVLGDTPHFDADPERVLRQVRSGREPLAVLMNPLSAEELFRVVQGGGLLPQKSTYFSPKIPSGLVLWDFQGSD